MDRKQYISEGPAGWREHGSDPQNRKQVAARGRFAVTALAYLVIASVVAFGAAEVLHANSQPALVPGLAFQGGPSTPKYLVLMVLDGARPDYFGLTPLPDVNALSDSGTQFTNAFDGILEAETPAGHATIATGSRPDKDDILGFNWATDTGVYSLFSPAKMTSVEQILENSNAPTIGSLYKSRFPQAKVVALSGHKYYAAAPLGGPDADAIMYYTGNSRGQYVPVAVPGHVPPAGVMNAHGLVDPTIHLHNGQEDDLVTKLALSAVSTMHPRILLINFPEFDWPLGHIDGGILDKAAVKTDMRGYDADLGRIEAAYRKAGILNQTLFVITADHGMMPITSFVPSSEINNAITQAGTTAPDIASSSGDYIWLSNGTKAQAVAENITAINDPGIQSAYYLTSVNDVVQYKLAAGSGISAADDRANQYLLGALLNGHEPSVVVFGKEGTSFTNPTTSHWKADHGGGSWQSQHVPLIIAGPGIHSGVVNNDPVQLDDVAPTVLTDMGVSPTGMEGDALTEALLKPTPAEKKARAAEARMLAPVAAALRSQETSTSAQAR